MNDLVVGPIRSEEIGVAARLLGYAFATNPGTVAIFGVTDAGRRRRFEQIAEATVLRRPVCNVLVARLDGRLAGVIGMTAWPGCEITGWEKLKIALLLLLALRGAVPRSIKLWAAWAKHHPRQPHWHIGPVGVQPELQGRGIGSRMLASCLQTVDQQKTAAYLVTDKAENARLYRRFGFAVAGEDDVIGVHMWYMWRQPG